MLYKDLISEHYNELSNMTSLLSTMVNSYRLLIGGASDLNSLSEARKSQVKEAVQRVDSLGDIIDDLIKSIDNCSKCYTKYCNIKKQFIEAKTNKDVILTEIDFDLDFDNSKREE